MTDEVRSFEEGLRDAGADALRPGEWMTYPEYRLDDRAGRKYVWAPETSEQLRGRLRYGPLSLAYADLFVEFAGWPERYGMTRLDPDSEENEKAALAWAKKYGVLGLQPARTEIIGEISLFVEDYLGRPNPPDYRTGRGMLNEGFGGTQETVAGFADEALQARAVLRLYDAATAHDTETIVGFMGQTGDEDFGYPGISEIYGRDPDTAREWALRVVRGMVNTKVAGRCFPSLHGEPGSYEQGWSFDSLLGAMWLQMLFRLTGQTRTCLWCGKVLVFGRLAEHGGKGRKTRSDKTFCDNGGLCRSKWNYHHGGGKSSKRARKEAREKAP